MPYDRIQWTGYLYRFWHFYSNENSKEIYVEADAQTMKETYLGFHTSDNTMAVDNLKEIYQQKRKLFQKIKSYRKETEHSIKSALFLF